MNTVDLIIARFKEVGYEPAAGEVFKMACNVLDLKKIYNHLTDEQIVKALIQKAEYGVNSP